MDEPKRDGFRKEYERALQLLDMTFSVNRIQAGAGAAAMLFVAATQVGPDISEEDFIILCRRSFQSAANMRVAIEAQKLSEPPRESN